MDAKELVPVEMEEAAGSGRQHLESYIKLQRICARSTSAREDKKMAGPCVPQGVHVIHAPTQRS